MPASHSTTERTINEPRLQTRTAESPPIWPPMIPKPTANKTACNPSGGPAMCSPNGAAETFTIPHSTKITSAAALGTVAELSGTCLSPGLSAPSANGLTVGTGGGPRSSASGVVMRHFRGKNECCRSRLARKPQSVAASAGDKQWQRQRHRKAEEHDQERGHGFAGRAGAHRDRHDDERGDQRDRGVTEPGPSGCCRAVQPQHEHGRGQEAEHADAQDAGKGDCPADPQLVAVAPLPWPASTAGSPTRSW